MYFAQFRHRRIYMTSNKSIAPDEYTWYKQAASQLDKFAQNW